VRLSAVLRSLRIGDSVSTARYSPVYCLPFNGRRSTLCP
jgi:hypothetical protein